MNKSKKKNNKKSSKNNNIDFKKYLKYIIPAVLAIIAGGIGISVAVNTEDGKIDVTINYAKEPAYIGDKGEFVEDIPTIDEIDGGGQFKDTLEGVNTDPSFYYERGAIEEVDTSSPQAFKNSTLGRCIIANNYFGAQCVSLARAFWWNYAGFDVSTCGTGLAKGMMKCSEENARDKFKVIWNTDEIQEGTWLVLDGTQTGHICMALSKVNHGYVSCLGENQGGVPCEYGVGGAGTNIINLSVKNFIGGYTPLDYIVPEPQPVPNPQPLSPDTGKGE